MKIKSNLIFNTSLVARHQTPDENATQVVIGSGAPEYLNIPAGSTIMLDDAEWEKFNTAAARSMVEAGDLTLVEVPVLSAEDQARADEDLEASLRSQMADLVARREGAEEGSEEDED